MERSNPNSVQEPKQFKSNLTKHIHNVQCTPRKSPIICSVLFVFFSEESVVGGLCLHVCILLVFVSEEMVVVGLCLCIWVVFVSDKSDVGGLCFCRYIRCGMSANETTFHPSQNL